MHQIIERQNEDNMLRLQFAARYCYNRAEAINNFIWLFSILSGATYVVLATMPETVQLAVPLALDILAGILEWRFVKNITLASSLRAYFDAYVFDLNWEGIGKIELQTLNERAIRIAERHYNEAQIQMKHCSQDDPPGVRDWYELPPDLPENDVIYECQRQNSWWNQRLWKKRLFRNIILCTIICAVIGIVIGALNKEANIWRLRALICFITILMKLAEFLISNIKYYLLSTKIDAVIENLAESRTTDNTIKLQKMLDDRRAMPVLERNRIHKRFASILSRTYQKTNVY